MPREGQQQLRGGELLRENDRILRTLGLFGPELNNTERPTRNTLRVV